MILLSLISFKTTKLFLSYKGIEASNMKSGIKYAVIGIFVCLSFVTRAQTDRALLDLQTTLRINMLLTGNKVSQSADISDMFLDSGRMWTPTQLISPFDFGEYRYMLIHPENGDTLFRKGFSTLFEEWRITDEAIHVQRSFEQTILMPAPLVSLNLMVEGRERDGTFSLLFRETIDPTGINCDSQIMNPFPSKIIYGEDLHHEKLNLLFLAEGYTSDQKDDFFLDVQRLANDLFGIEPYNSMKEHLVIRALAVPSNESGTTDPLAGVSRDTYFKSSFNTLNVDRYLYSESAWKVYEAASQVPHDHIVVVVNSNKYGGGAIYNHFSIVTARNRYSGVVLIHELGHGLVGLGDEYFGSEVTYNDYINIETEPWQPNLTTLVDFESKWKNLVPSGTPIPTPVRPAYKDVTGVFEGGGYVAQGVYRPAVFCRMRTNQAIGFCEVCRLVTQQKIEFYCR
jgi:hypothetical protein